MTLYRILTDADVASALSMGHALDAIEVALREKSEGGLIAPPRFEVEAGKRTLVFTVGASTSKNLAGFRVYGRPDSPDAQQVVVVFNQMTGALSGIIVGDLIGELRTGAIGGVAVKHMARPDSQILGIIGSGPQARAQLEAAASVLSFQKVTVFSRTAEKRERFAAEMSEKLAIEVRPASSPEEAVREADVLICATSSGTPVFKAEWLKAGVHINTIGPKFTVAHEIEIQVADRSRVIATDSLAQVNAYHPAFFLSDTPHRQRVVELGDIVAGAESGRTSPEDVTLFCSVGLAGTEVVVAAEVIRRLKSND